MITAHAKCALAAAPHVHHARWLTGLLFLAALVLAAAAIPAHAADNGNGAQPFQHGNPIANFWRAQRQSQAGITTESGPYTTDKFIQNGGQNWRQIRNGLIANYGGWLLGLALAAVAAVFALRGRIRIEAGPSGKRVLRFSVWQRIVHWYTAACFVLLALSGLIILFGRALLIPLLGKDAFSVLAEGSKWTHNFVGPLFVVAVLMLIVTFAAGNIYRKGDGKWFASGGGMVKGRHASAGRYNAGEKSWFWLATIAGILVAVTGIILDFPGFGQTREVMQLAEVVHATAALIFIAVSFGHIYIGTLGMEGAIDAMAKGHVDANWARQHHDQWYEEMERQGMVKPAEELETPAKESTAQNPAYPPK